MTDSIGPGRTLPGAIEPPANATCDIHSGRPAVVSVLVSCVEAAEVLSMCQECYEAYKDTNGKGHAGICDWCKKKRPDLQSHRDFEEGQGGPVYEVCGDCIKEENKRAGEELEDLDGYSPYDD
jgi:hypothetical protein